MASRKNKISKEQQRWNRLESGDLVFRSKSAANLTELDLLEVVAVNPSARIFLAKDYSNKIQLVQERKFITEEELAKQGVVIKNMDALRGKGEKQKEDSKGFYLGTCNMSSCKSGLPATFYNSGSYAHYCIICARRINEDNLPYVGYDLCKEVSGEEVGDVKEA